MIALLDTSDDLQTMAAELGCPVEHLLTPSGRRALQSDTEMFAIDNGAFGGLNVRLFENLLKLRYPQRNRCRWVVVPDVVGSARRTLEVFHEWKNRLGAWPLALAAQDGLEDYEIPWKQIEAIFIGGTTAWKLSKDAAAVIRAAQAMGKWVHAGRVNTPSRFEYFEALGCDSIDGTGLEKYSWMRKAIYDAHAQPSLLTVCEKAEREYFT